MHIIKENILDIISYVGGLCYFNYLIIYYRACYWIFGMANCLLVKLIKYLNILDIINYSKVFELQIQFTKYQKKIKVIIIKMRKRLLHVINNKKDHIKKIVKIAKVQYKKIVFIFLWKNI